MSRGTKCNRDQTRLQCHAALGEKRKEQTAKVDLTLTVVPSFGGQTMEETGIMDAAP